MCIRDRAHGDDAAGLGEPVRREDGGDAQFAAQPFDEPQRDHGRAGDDQAQGGEVVVVALGVVEERLVEGGRPGEYGDPLGGDVREDGVHVEHGLRDHRGPAHQAGDDPRLVAEGVEEGVHDQVAVALAQSGELAPHVVAAQGLGVGDDRALGAAGGAGGEDDVGGGLGADGLGALADRCGRYAVPARQEVLPRAEGVGGVVGEDDDLFQVRQSRQRSGAGALGRGAAQGGDVGGTEEGAGDEEQPGPAALQDVRGLRALETGVEGDEHRAGRDGAEGGDDPLQGVGGPDGHPVAGLGSGGDAGRGGALDAFAELRVTDPGAPVDDGLAVGVPCRCRPDELRDAAPTQIPAHVLAYGLAPVVAHACHLPTDPVADYPSD